MSKISKQHWEKIYSCTVEDELSWFIADPDVSLTLIESTGVAKSDPIIDIGAGASRLIDHLLAHGFTNLTALDLSGAGLELARRRLAEQAQQITWLEADVTNFEPPRTYRLWHDRAVFHFLVDPEDQAAYLARLGHALQPDGHAIIATFSLNGPDQCSGLPVVQYDADKISALLGDAYCLLNTIEEVHRTPAGALQEFNYFHFRRLAAG